MISYKRKTCRLCNSKKIEVLMNFIPTSLVDNFRKIHHEKIDLPPVPMDLYICNVCKHVQLLDVVYPQYIYDDYTYVSSSSPDLLEHFKGLCEEIIKYTSIRKNSIVLDIGCNEGILLNEFRKKNYKTIGVDPDKKSLINAKKKGIITFNKYFNEKLAYQLKKKYQSLNLIIATNVYAHDDKLIEFTYNVYNLLKAGGYFVFEVSYLRDLLKSKVWDYVYHEHLSYHSIKPLHLMLGKVGFNIEKIVFKKVKGGSIRCYAKKISKKINNKNVQKYIFDENKSGIYNIENYKKLLKEKAKIRKKINIFINKNFNKKTIASYGASATCTVIAQEYDYSKHLSFILDDNKFKHKTLSPGFLIPVYKASNLNKMFPDLLIISAWRFKDLILIKCKDYLDKGGVILVPHPKPYILKVKNKVEKIRYL